jgi:hypothetical protein
MKTSGFKLYILGAKALEIEYITISEDNLPKPEVISTP